MHKDRFKNPLEKREKLHKQYPAKPSEWFTHVAMPYYGGLDTAVSSNGNGLTISSPTSTDMNTAQVFQPGLGYDEFGYDMGKGMISKNYLKDLEVHFNGRSVTDYVLENNRITLGDSVWEEINKLKMKKTLFLDVDNTLVVPKSSKTKFASAGDWVFKTGIIEWLNNNHKDYDQVILVTNQGGVMAGYKTPQDVEEYIVEVVDGLDIILNIRPLVFIAYLPEDRKPGLGNFIKDLGRLNSETHKEEYNGGHYFTKKSLFSNIDLEKSLMIGDASGCYKVFSKETGRYMFITHAGYEVVDFEILRKDFSDSDKVFANNLGIHYLDVDELLK